MSWILIIFINSGGLESKIEHIEFKTISRCQKAEAIIEKNDSNSRAICVKK